METLETTRYQLLRSLVYLGIFVVLHFAYDWFPNSVIALFSGTSESFFQHMKIGFYSYVVLSAVEFSVFKQVREQQGGFIYARMSGAVIIPFFIFLIWFCAPALAGKIRTIPGEVGFSCAVTFAACYCTGIFDSHLWKTAFRRDLKILIIILFLISIFLFTVFTFRLPWVDMFELPEM